MEKVGSGIRDGDSSDPGSRMEKVGSGIWDKHPGSATLCAIVGANMSPAVFVIVPVDSTGVKVVLFKNLLPTRNTGID
jgi:hypothetical protein